MTEFKDICQTENLEDKFSYFEKFGASYDKNNSYIQTVPFCDLSEYWFYLQPQGPDTRFRKGVNIDDAIVSYVFDKELKSLMMKAIQDIEKYLKQCLIAHVCQHGDEISVFKKGAWIDKKYIKGTASREEKQEYARYNVNIKNTFKKIEKQIEKEKKQDTSVNNCNIINKISFGTLKTMYKISNKEIQNEIAAEFSKIQSAQFQTLLDVLNTIRNKSAHYERLWNVYLGGFTGFHDESKERHGPKKEKHVLYNVTNNNEYRGCKIYNLLVWIIYMLNQRHFKNIWKHELLILMKKYEERGYEIGMGFPEGWREMDFWK